MLKCSRDRCVCAPQSLSAGTLTGPRLSCSIRVAVMADPFVRACPMRENQLFFWSRTLAGRGGWTTNSIKCRQPPCSSVSPAMNEAPTTVIIQRYLDALPGDAAEPVVRDLLER